MKRWGSVAGITIMFIVYLANVAFGPKSYRAVIEVDLSRRFPISMNIWGQTFSLGVDPARLASLSMSEDLGYVSPDVWGHNFLPSPAYLTAEDFYTKMGGIENIRNLGTKMIRFPGGCPSEQYYWDGERAWVKRTDWQGIPQPDTEVMPLQEFMKIVQDLDVDFIYEINMSYPKGLPLPGNCNSRSLYPSIDLTEEERFQVLAADARRIATYLKNHPVSKDRTRYYELGNEQYLSWDIDEYVRGAERMAKIIRSIDPEAVILITGGRVVYPVPEKDAWGMGIKNALQSGLYNMPTIHSYITETNNIEFGAYPFTHIIKTRAEQYAPWGLAVTEWNKVCWVDTMLEGNKTIDHGIFVADGLLTMAENGTRIGILHNLTFNNSCGLFIDGKPTPVYYAFQLTSVLAGGFMAATKVDSADYTVINNPDCGGWHCIFGEAHIPNVTAYSGFSPDGKFFIFIINRGDNPVILSLPEKVLVVNRKDTVTETGLAMEAQVAEGPLLLLKKSITRLEVSVPEFYTLFLPLVVNGK